MVPSACWWSGCQTSFCTFIGLWLEWPAQPTGTRWSREYLLLHWRFLWIFFLRNEKVLHHCFWTNTLLEFESEKSETKTTPKKQNMYHSNKKKYQNCSLDEIPVQRKYVSPPFRRWACGCNLQENAARSTTWIISWIPPNHYVKGNSRDPQKWDPHSHTTPIPLGVPLLGVPEKCLIM